MEIPEVYENIQSVPHRGETWHSESHMAKTGICRHDEKQRPTVHSDLKLQALSRATVHMLFHKGVHSRKKRDSHLWDGSIILTPNVFLWIILVYLWRGFKYDPLKKISSHLLKWKAFFSEYHRQYSPVFLLYSILQLSSVVCPCLCNSLIE